MANVLSDRILEDLDRLRFQSLERVDWARLVPMIPVGLLGAVTIAAALTMMHEWGIYFIVVVPACAAVAANGVVRFVIERGHCRSQLVAFLIAMPIGLIAYLGYYQGHLVRSLGWEMVYRIDLLPEIIWMNWKTQLIVGRRGFQGPPDELTFTCNVLLFLVELMMIVVAACLGGQTTVGRVYSESRRCWARSVTRIAPEMWGPEIEQSIRANDFAELLTLIEVMPIPDPKHPPPRTILTLEFFGDGAFPPAYLTVTHVPKASSVIVRQLLLKPAEFNACRPLFLPYYSYFPDGQSPPD